MTHSGGKPHAVGYRGQRYEVTYFEPRENVRKVYGWSATVEVAQAMANGIEAHPVWEFPQIADLRASPERTIGILQQLISDLSAALADEGPGWSNEGLDSLRRRVATALPAAHRPGWLRQYDEPALVQSTPGK